VEAVSGRSTGKKNGPLGPARTTGSILVGALCARGLHLGAECRSPGPRAGVPRAGRTPPDYSRGEPAFWTLAGRLSGGRLGLPAVTAAGVADVRAGTAGKVRSDALAPIEAAAALAHDLVERRVAA
jgi:hypothetical protein